MKTPGLSIFTKGKKLESEIQNEIKGELQKFGWMVFVTHGNEFQSGFPDLYCIHPKYGARWVEVKNPNGYAFTKAQMETFPKFSSCDIGVWILTSADKSEIDKLFGPANWWAYLSVMK